MNMQELMYLPDPRELLAAMKEVSSNDQSFKRKYHKLLQQFEARIVDEEERMASMIQAHADFEMGQAFMSHHDPYVFYDDDCW